MMPRHFPAFVLTAIGLVLTAGVWQFCRLSTLVTRHEQDTLLSHATSVARSLPHTHYETLSFSAEDAQRPLYHQLHQELATASRHLGLRGLFTIAERDGSYVFWPESYPSNHPYASLPGTVYRLPPAEVSIAFSKRLPCVSSLITDEFGQFITAFVPVLDPYSGKVSFLLAADMDLPILRRRLTRVCGTSAALTLSTIILLGMLWFLISRRIPSPRLAPQYRQYAETFLCALILLLITGSITLHLYVTESQMRSKTLLTAAQQQTALISAEFHAISKGLDGIDRVFQASETVTEDEFSHFTSHIIRDYAIRAVTWSPAVKQDEAEAFEKEVRGSGKPTYRIWRNAETNSVEAVDSLSGIVYPILFVNPLAGHENALGFDQMSSPARQEGIRRALSTGAPFATRPETLLTHPDQPTGVLIYCPVASQTQTGIVALAYCVDNALRIPLARTAASSDAQGLVVELFHLPPHAEPERLAATDTATPLTARARPWPPFSSLQAVNTSLFAFGNTYGVVILASPAWMAAHPLRQWATAAVAGGLLTVFITAFLVMLANRRLMLEREVHSRTVELQLEHEKVAGVLSAAPVAMMLVDRETRVLNANPRAERLVDNDVLACVAQPCGVFLTCVHHKETADGCGHGIPCKNCVLRNTIREVAENGKPVFDRDMALTTERQGREETYYVKFGASPVMLKGQRHVVIAIYDVTDWYRTEQIYRTLFNEMDDGFLLVEKTGTAPDAEVYIRAANPAVQKLAGHDIASLVGTVLGRSFLIPVVLLENIQQVFETGKACRAQFFFEDIKKYVSCTVFRPMDRQVAVIFTDITEQKRAEQALLHERSLLYALMDNQPDRIFFKDAGLRFIKVSKEQARSLGLPSPAQAIGKTLEDLQPGDASRRTMEHERTILRTGKPLFAQVEKSVDAAGHAHWDSVSKAPLHDESGACVGIVGIARDITPEIELQQHLQQMTKMDAIGRLAGGVAHDFNNLLQAILGYTELLLSGTEEDSPQHGDLKEIERAAKRAADLTRQLLTFSRKQRIEPVVLDLNQTILSTVNMLKRLIGDTVHIEWYLDPALKTVLIDPSQMEQILLNLAVNAKDAMPSGGTLTFRTEMAQIDDEAAASHLEAHPGTFVKLTVSDTGQGIPEDVIPYVFEPFFTTKERGKGTGLGLSVIYGIVKQCGGWVNVTSSKNNGTHFSLYFPAQNTKADVSGEEKHPVFDGPTTLSGIGKTILLVEDEQGVRNLAALVLQNAGYKIHVCSGAEEAKAVFAKERDRIDLLFSDIVLIGQNGIDLALDLRKQKPTLPCLLCSGYANETVPWESLQKEGFHFLPKPYPVAKLMAAVAEALAVPG